MNGVKDMRLSERWLMSSFENISPVKRPHFFNQKMGAKERGKKDALDGDKGD